MKIITPLRREQLEQVGPVLARSPHKPYSALRLPPAVPVDALWLREVADALDADAGAVFAARVGSEVAGLAVCASQDWESRVLERKVAVLKHLVVPADDPHGPETLELLIRQVLAWAKACGVELLSCKAYTDDLTAINALERHGFLLRDTMLDYVYDPHRDPFDTVPRPEPFPGCTIRLATADDRGEVLRVSENAFGGHFGRFHSDPRLPRDVSTRVYREWLRSSCDGYADYLVVAEVAGRVVGYSVWKKPCSREEQFGLRLGRYSIGAVHHDFAGRGLFEALTHAGMARLREAVDRISGPTHVNNYPVQRGYTKLRWRIANAYHTLHRWLTN